METWNALRRDFRGDLRGDLSKVLCVITGSQIRFKIPSGFLPGRSAQNLLYVLVRCFLFQLRIVRDLKPTSKINEVSSRFTYFKHLQVMITVEIGLIIL